MQGYKTDFPLLMQDKTVYIDNAATAQRPKCVIDAEKILHLPQCKPSPWNL